MKLIFCGNLHCGGGVQVATSFIQEISNTNSISDIDLIISTEIYEELKKLNVTTEFFNTTLVLDFYGIKKPSSFIKNKKKYSVCFVIFGPIYYSLNSKKYIVGFAQPWIAYNKNDAYKKLSFFNKIKNKLSFYLKDILFRRYTTLIVEHQHVKDALVKKGYKSEIYIVSNTYSSIFEDFEKWDAIPSIANMDTSLTTLGYIGRAYTHKNLEILKGVNSILIHKYNKKVNFIFTLNQYDMERLGFINEENFYSIGPINLNQCPNFYKSIDALIFPTMLECFSVSPIEAMKMNVPILTSNYSFMKDTCKNAAIYFNATSSEDIAEKIIYFLDNKNLINKNNESSIKEILSEIPSAKNRAIAYMRLIKNIN